MFKVIVDVLTLFGFIIEEGTVLELEVLGNFKGARMMNFSILVDLLFLGLLPACTLFPHLVEEGFYFLGRVIGTGLMYLVGDVGTEIIYFY